MNNVLAGAAVGAAATVPMTIFWETLHPRLPGEPPRPLPPREVAEALAVKFGVNRELTEIQMQWLALALHFGYGMLTGAVFGTIAPRRTEPPSAAGSCSAWVCGPAAISVGCRQPASGIHHGGIRPPARRW